ncbi:cyclopropane fatty acid synthase [Lentinus brumalis]|uniref:Cyclopropane fatty acid synthase n=1 Tax=Lentinus brumalis TaxID=2498619 RepID=A0A371DFL5_9APHY|nr:cyclopropane fatty acid synthase [Polyporus brumalis]
MPSTHGTLPYLPTLRSRLVSAGYIRSWLSDSLTNYAKHRILDVLRKGVLKGSLRIEDKDNTYDFGTSTDKEPTVIMKVRSPDVWMRILTSADIGIAEAYMFQDIDVSSLTGLFGVWLDNRDTLLGLESGLSGIFAQYSALAMTWLGRYNPYMSKRHVEFAYDISNSFFQAFLSEDMMYSCPVWSDEENGINGDLKFGPTPGDLEAAQQRKIQSIIRKARLRPGDRLLEIGSGWGAMAVAAAKLGCTVDTITLSKEQLTLVEERARAAGVADRIRVHLCDYRDLPKDFEHSFDALISTEMIEAVGKRYLPTYFQVIDWALKTDRATMVLTSTSQPEHRHSEYQSDDFCRRYHWPNVYLPSATSLAVSVQDACPGKFVFTDLEDHTFHYPRALREWGRRLEKNFTPELAKELQDRFPLFRDPKELEAFRRKWLYMFAYAEVGFARGYTTLPCWTFTRPENVPEVCA